MLVATVGGVRVVNVYIPNGESVTSDKYQYKLNWLKQLDTYLQTEIKTHPKMIILGDFNIAPEEMDVHDPKQWEGQVLCSVPERQAFQNMLKLGFVDCFRSLVPEEKSFSWWDYRMNAFKRNLGLRIDHILASSPLAPGCRQVYIDKIPRAWERPSDHAPVVGEFEV